MNPSARPYRSLILGGVKSGKSSYAERMAKAYAKSEGADVTLIATARAGDKEMQARIERHKADRDKQWRLVEEPLMLADALNTIDQRTIKPGRCQCIVIDCLTMWVTNLLMQQDDNVLRMEIDNFQRSVQHCRSRLIIVSNETNLGVTPMGELSRRFCDEAGLLHQALGQSCDHVVLMVAGISLTIKESAQKQS